MDLKDYEIEYNQMVEKIQTDLKSEFKHLDFKSGLYYLTKFNYKYFNSDDVVGCFDDKLWVINKEATHNVAITPNGTFKKDREYYVENERMDQSIKLLNDLFEDLVKRYIIHFNDNNPETIVYEKGMPIKLSIAIDCKTLQDVFVASKFKILDKDGIVIIENGYDKINIPDIFVENYLNQYDPDDIKAAYYFKNKNDFISQKMDVERFREHVRFYNDLIHQPHGCRAYEVPNFNSKEIFEKCMSKYHNPNLNEFYTGRYFYAIQL